MTLFNLIFMHDIRTSKTSIFITLLFYAPSLSLSLFQSFHLFILFYFHYFFFSPWFNSYSWAKGFKFSINFLFETFFHCIYDLIFFLSLSLSLYSFFICEQYWFRFIFIGIISTCKRFHDKSNRVWYRVRHLTFF